MDESSKEKRTRMLQRQIRPERILAIGFLAVILIGTGLLCLPAATTNHRSLNVFDSFFTATSAVCVTGLVAVDTGTTFSFFGQAVLLLLIEIGALGFMVFATLIMELLGRKLSLKNRVLIRESMSGTTLSGLVQLTEVYLVIALLIELAGALLLSIRFVPMYGVSHGIWMSVFHSVSAFCNAGFDLFGHFSSLTGFYDDPLVVLTIGVLVILGSMGFLVIFELLRTRFRWRRLSLHARTALIAMGALLAFGTAFFTLAEWSNPATLNTPGATVGTKLLGAFFQSLNMRSGGFNTIDLSALTSASKLVATVLMFIGASPASTGGGVKTTTVMIVLLVVWSVIRGSSDVTIMKRRLSPELTRRALTIVTIALFLLLLCAVGLTWAEHDELPFIDLLFEACSATATVGASTIPLKRLSIISRALLIPMMYFGRVGPLTLALALANRQSRAQIHIRYPEDKIMIG